MSTGGDPSGSAPRRGEGTADDQTFADVLNAFSFDNARRRRKKSRPSEAPDSAAARDREETPPPALTHPVAPALPEDEQQLDAWELDQDDTQGSASIVRAYAWTGGRTRGNYNFQIETLVTTTDLGHHSTAVTRADQRAVSELCWEPRSVAEVAALLSVPLGVAKVLLSDMAEHGLISVHQTATPDGASPDSKLLERVLIGLRRL
ncbi:DUF742 domain-containing protein [Streptomyces silvisoli]|uniref:DUF742 domain-containing protein n=1 Tax=Streptomyces silvisoli TaxID=3034235 RepID=A0ABT5ZUJ7_9ACTN|nr:DUF742 domain-containing protein [Streptomyces silvisoli]MDF3293275.1 DUF742 domain-containing protein [Streptomyces silvisoli]